LNPPLRKTAEHLSPKEHSSEETPKMTDSADRDLDSAVLAELRRLARSRPTSGREAMAQVAAIPDLGATGGRRKRREIPPMPPGWHPGPPEFERLDACDDEATRERLWANLYGR
jgi:hypothetical protein